MFVRSDKDEKERKDEGVSSIDVGSRRKVSGSKKEAMSGKQAWQKDGSRGLADRLATKRLIRE